MNGFFLLAPAAKPGDDLLFHRLGDSTIGAVWFHGRVRDGIGWVTDAMVTQLCGRRKKGEIDACTKICCISNALAVRILADPAVQNCR